MPNIFKRFLQPNASDFVFPDVEELVEEEPADTAGEQEGEPEESAPEAEEKDTPSAVDFAQIQAEKILEDARRQAEDYLARRQMEAEQEAEQVRQQAQSEGYRQGYAEWLRQAGVEGQAELQKQREQQAEELQAFLEKATAAREEHCSAWVITRSRSRVDTLIFTTGVSFRERTRSAVPPRETITSNSLSGNAFAN